MVAQREIPYNEEEAIYNEIIDKMLSQNDIKLIREQSLFYLVYIFLSELRFKQTGYQKSAR